MGLINVGSWEWREWLRRLRQPKPWKGTKLRPGQFLCDRHWQEVTASWGGEDPIDAMSVTIGLTLACHMAGVKGPQRHACCALNRVGWQGILRRARKSWATSPSQSKSA